MSDMGHETICRDPAMLALQQQAEIIAAGDAPLLISGEAGSGKARMARFIHARSRRSERPIVVVNCAASDEQGLDFELFGPAESNNRGGKFKNALGSCLLLEEISALSPALQAKLSQRLHIGKALKGDATRQAALNVRLLATSTRNLEEAVQKGAFREDLFRHLGTQSLALPALRDRPLDIEPLAELFIEQQARANGLPCPRLSRSALEALFLHTWRGNLGELQSSLRRAVLLAEDGVIAARHIALSDRCGRLAKEYVPGQDDLATPLGLTTPLIGRSIAEVEQELIIDTLTHCLGNRTRAANILGISIRTLRNKLKLYSEAGRVVPPPSGEGSRPLA